MMTTNYVRRFCSYCETLIPPERGLGQQGIPMYCDSTCEDLKQREVLNARFAATDPERNPFPDRTIDEKYHGKQYFEDGESVS